jgi:hypothetical protein
LIVAFVYPQALDPDTRSSVSSSHSNCSSRRRSSVVASMSMFPRTLDTASRRE